MLNAVTAPWCMGRPIRHPRVLGGALSSAPGLDFPAAVFEARPRAAGAWPILAPGARRWGAKTVPWWSGPPPASPARTAPRKRPGQGGPGPLSLRRFQTLALLQRSSFTCGEQSSVRGKRPRERGWHLHGPLQAARGSLMTAWPERGLTKQKRHAEGDEPAPHVKHGPRSLPCAEYPCTITHFLVIAQVRLCRVGRL